MIKIFEIVFSLFLNTQTLISVDLPCKNGLCNNAVVAKPSAVVIDRYAIGFNADGDVKYYLDKGNVVKYEAFDDDRQYFTCHNYICKDWLSLKTGDIVTILGQDYSVHSINILKMGSYVSEVSYFPAQLQTCKDNNYVYIFNLTK